MPTSLRRHSSKQHVEPEDKLGLIGLQHFWRVGRVGLAPDYCSRKRGSPTCSDALPSRCSMSRRIHRLFRPEQSNGAFRVRLQLPRDLLNVSQAIEHLRLSSCPSPHSGVRLSNSGLLPPSFLTQKAGSTG